MAVKVSGTTVIDGSRNIINVGNVDGRDVSVDGAKLDGIAAGAEVNQNAFSSVVVAGQSDVVADAKTDALNLAAGTGVSITTDATTDTVTFTNTAPDQVVSLTGSGATSVSGTYPNFTISSTDNNTTYTAGTGLSLFGTTFSIDSTVATLTGTQTLTNKRINSRTVAASGTSGTLTINSDTTDLYKAEGLTDAITLDVPSGTPVDGQRLVIRLEDDGTARGITWTTTSGGFRAIGITLPTTTVATKITYVGCMYNATDGFWDIVALTTQA